MKDYPQTRTTSCSSATSSKMISIEANFPMLTNMVHNGDVILVFAVGVFRGGVQI